MDEEPTASQDLRESASSEAPSLSPAQARKVPVHERACVVGRFIGINAYRINRRLLKQRLREGSYQLHETAHFLLCVRDQAPATIVVHWFAPEEIDANIGYYFLQELKPLGVLAEPSAFGDLFGAVVFSFVPDAVEQALSLYAANTLQRYRQRLSLDAVQTTELGWNAPIDVFSKLYRRVYALRTGETFLDAGCSFGFLPLLLAERFPALRRIVGLDLQTEPFEIVRTIARERQLTNVSFAQADLLTNDVSNLGLFDTVTLLHVLEHFTEEEMYCALTHLLRITSQRLIIAVPYEIGEPEVAYGHEQLFSRPRLEAVGAWCLQQWDGRGRMSYEDCADGLLVLERDL